MKRKLFVILPLLSLIIVGCGKKETEIANIPDTPPKPSEEVNDFTINQFNDKEVDGLVFNKVSITYENGESKVITSVTNNNEEDYELVEFIIIARNLIGNEIARFPGYVGNVIHAGETLLINSSIDIDLTSAYDVDFAIIK